MVGLLVQLATEQILTPDLRQKAISILAKQQFTGLLTRQLPYDPFDEEEGVASTSAVRIASKYGAVRGVRNDVGLVTTSKTTYAIALMSKDCADQRFHPDNEAALVLPQISRLIYEHYQGHGEGSSL
jgi:beta-lactamase class A